MTYEEILDFWRGRILPSGDEFQALITRQAIEFAANSGKIENPQVTYYDTREIFKHGSVSSYTGSLTTLFEINDAKCAYLYVLDALQRRQPLDEPVLLEMHRLLTLNTYDEGRLALGERPGAYRTHDFDTGKTEVGAPFADVPDEMDELLQEFLTLDKNHALTTAAYFHAKFENIHPFADGNGRTGRLSMNYLLLLMDHPPITIFEEDRKEYYSTLVVWDTVQDLNPMKKFLRSQTVKTWERRLGKL